MNRESDLEESGQPDGRYANYFKIGQNAFEFVFEFGQLDPERKSVVFHTRIITNPICAKALLSTLRKAVDRYEKDHGAILDEQE